MSFFTKSPTEKHIAVLTDENVRELNLAGCMALTDQINIAPDESVSQHAALGITCERSLLTDGSLLLRCGRYYFSPSGKEALKVLMKRVKHKNAHVQLLALGLLDLCVKNGHTALAQNLATKDHLKLLSEVGTDPKVPNIVRDTVLTMMENWHEAFSRPREFQLPLFSEFYYALKRRGVEFPPRDMAALPPVFTPSAGQQREARPSSAMPLGADPYGEHSGVAVFPQAGQNSPGQGASPLQQQPYQPPQYHAGPQYPVAQPVYNQPYQPQLQQQQQYQQQPQYPPQQQYQQPPPQQQPPTPQRESAAERAERKRAKLTPSQLQSFAQCATLSPEYTAKVKTESLLTIDYIRLLMDLSSAADSPQALREDSLASNLQRVCALVRERFTKLILEVSDLLSPETATAAEFLIDLSIRLIDLCRVVLDYHQQRCDGVPVQPPELVLPRGLDGSSDQRQPQSSPRRNGPSKSPPVAESAAAASAPREMQLFELPSELPGEEDEKVAVANIFASHRTNRPSSASVTSPQPQPASSHAVGSSSSPPVTAREYVSPPRFQSAEAFSPQQAFDPITEKKAVDPLSEEPPGYVDPEQVIIVGEEDPAFSTPFDDPTPKHAASASGSDDAAASVFDLLAPMRSAQGAPGQSSLRKAPNEALAEVVMSPPGAAKHEGEPSDED